MSPSVRRRATKGFTIPVFTGEGIKRAGVPTRLTPALLEDIVKKLTTGASVARCAGSCGVSPNALAEWLSKGADPDYKGTIFEELVESVARSRDEFAVSSHAVIASGRPGWKGRAWLAERLSDLGFQVTRHSAVGDRLDDIAELWTTTDYAPAVAAAKGDTMPKTIAATATVEDIRRAYYDTAGWDLWIEEIQLAPLQLIIVDDSDGTRARVAVVIDPAKDGADAITFGETVPVVVRYDDVTPAADPAAEGGAQVAASKLRFASRAESQREIHAGRPGKEVSAMAADTTPANNSGGLTDDQKAALRDVLGLTDQADDATFAAALEALVKKAQADAGEDAADGGADEATEDASAGGDSAAADDQTDDPKKVAASVGTATVTIDAAAWDDLQTFIASAREREKADRERAADEMVDANAVEQVGHAPRPQPHPRVVGGRDRRPARRR